MQFVKKTESYLVSKHSVILSPKEWIIATLYIITSIAGILTVIF